jgi:hypothetical protein
MFDKVFKSLLLLVLIVFFQVLYNDHSKGQVSANNPI